jgi:uncharacterized membrane protein
MDDNRRSLWGSVRHLPADLAAVVALTVLALVGVSLPGLQGTLLRVALVVPLLVALPGYALLAALFPRGRTVVEPGDDPDGGDITGPERAVLSVVLSLALVPMVGLVLTVTPPGFDGVWVTAGVSAVTVGCVVVACVRNHGGPATGFRGNSPRQLARRLRRGFATGTRREMALNAVVVVGVVIAVVLTGAAVFLVDGGEEFTGFYLLSADGEQFDTEYPGDLSTGESAPLVVGIDNREGESVRYTVVVQLQEVAGTNDTGVQTRHDLASYATGRLDGGETWERRHDIQPTVTGDRLRLQYLLYRGSPPDSPTRANAALRTHLWLTVTDAE